MPVALCVLGVVFATTTAISHWPIHRNGVLAFFAFVIGWLVAELPFHGIAVQSVTAAILVARGGLGDGLGWLGLGLTAASIVGLVQHLRLATDTTVAVERGLADALGRDYHDRIAPALRRAYDPTTSWTHLIVPWPRRPRDVVRIRDLEYGRVGPRRLLLDVFHPAPGASGADATEAGARPVFLYVHGGGWVLGNKNQQGLPTIHELARAGWVCVTIDYRLSPRATFPDHLLDVKRAIAWTRANIGDHGGDPAFIVIGGGSAGGHLAALAALTANASEYQRDLPDVDTSVAGCVSYYGVYDFADRHDEYRHGMFRTMLERVVMKRRFAEAREEFDKASPIARIHAAAPPFLLVHGVNDSLVPIGHARRFRDALVHREAQVAWIELPGAQHAFEVFPSLRSVPTVHGVHRWCQHLFSQYLIARDARRAD